MSDTSQGEDWWLGTDGKWYPPAAPAAPVGPPPQVADPAEVPAAEGKSSKRLLILGGLVAVVVIVAAVAGVLVLGGGSSPKHDIGGTFTLQEGTLSAKPGAPCTAKGAGYGDIRAGSPVTVSDGDGKVLATGQLGAGSLGPNVISNMSYCVFPVSVLDVPKSDLYQIEVSHRGEITHSHQEMEDTGWQVALTLG